MADDAGKIYERRSIERGRKQTKIEATPSKRYTLMKYLVN
jgi:hypothetical protein